MHSPRSTIEFRSSLCYVYSTEIGEKGWNPYNWRFSRMWSPILITDPTVKSSSVRRDLTKSFIKERRTNILLTWKRSIWDYATGSES
jgi:hypothetical protein